MSDLKYSQKADEILGSLMDLVQDESISFEDFEARILALMSVLSGTIIANHYHRAEGPRLQENIIQHKHDVMFKVIKYAQDSVAEIYANKEAKDSTQIVEMYA